LNDQTELADLRFLPVLRLESERLRLGPSGLMAVVGIAGKWKLTDEQVRQLLAVSPEQSLEQAKSQPDPQFFTLDRILRISYLVGIYHGIQSSCGEALADEWIRRPNDGKLFGGLSPLEYMIRGGVWAMRDVRALLDAWCAGNW
jgi:hypothetical protein